MGKSPLLAAMAHRIARAGWNGFVTLASLIGAPSATTVTLQP
jgi:hypothetical protein